MKYTKEMYFVDDGDIIEINLNEVRFEDYYGKRQQKSPQKIDWEETAAEKSGYKFFMEKEITEEPDVIKKALTGRISEDRIHLDEIFEWKDLLKKVKTVKVIAAGTSYHSGMVFKYFLNELLPISAIR